MPVKIRLTRRGRKKAPFYHIVIADSRAPRDGRFIESIGKYNPITNPATIELDFDKALEWLLKGAQPTDTCRAILSYKGVMMKKHLLEGVKKGAFTEEQAEEKFQAWSAEKEAKVTAKEDSLSKAKDDSKAAALAAEVKVNEDRLAAVQEVENEAIKVAADAKAAAEAAKNVVEEVAPETIDDAQAAASDDGKEE